MSVAKINFKKIGGLVRIEIDDDPLSANRVHYANKASLDVEISPEANGIVNIRIDEHYYQLAAITDVQFDGVGATNMADFETKIALVFPEVGGGTSTPAADQFTILSDPEYYDVPAGDLLHTAILMPATDADLTLGTTDGGDELLESFNVLADDGHVAHLNIFSTTNTTRVYFGGLPVGSSVAINVITVL